MLQVAKGESHRCSSDGLPRDGAPTARVEQRYHEAVVMRCLPAIGARSRLASQPGTGVVRTEDI